MWTPKYKENRPSDRLLIVSDGSQAKVLEYIGPSLDHWGDSVGFDGEWFKGEPAGVWVWEGGVVSTPHYSIDYIGPEYDIDLEGSSRPLTAEEWKLWEETGCPWDPDDWHEGWDGMDPYSSSTNRWIELIRAGDLGERALARIKDTIDDPVVLQFAKERYPRIDLEWPLWDEETDYFNLSIKPNPPRFETQLHIPTGLGFAEELLLVLKIEWRPWFYARVTGPPSSLPNGDPRPRALSPSDIPEPAAEKARDAWDRLVKSQQGLPLADLLESQESWTEWATFLTGRVPEEPEEKEPVDAGEIPNLWPEFASGQFVPS